MLSDRDRRKLDETADERFYASPRYVTVSVPVASSRRER